MAINNQRVGGRVTAHRNRYPLRLLTLKQNSMTTKKLKTGLWIVENPTPNGQTIEVFHTYEEAERFMFAQLPYLKFLTQLKNLFR
jgi:hypothetical protein